jgi:hypothetical protein
MTGEEWQAWCDTRVVDDEPPDPGWDDEEEDPGEQVAWSAGFAKGGAADGLPGGSELAFLADAAAGPEDRYAGASDGELDGLIAAWDRVEAHAAARKHLAIAEFIRRRPEQGCEPADPKHMPERWDEFAADELRVLLAESKATAERMMDRAADLASRLPGTMALFNSGKLRQSKVTIIVDVTAPLDAEESRAAEDLVLGRAERLTPSGLRAAIAHRRTRARGRTRLRAPRTQEPRQTRETREAGETPDGGRDGAGRSRARFHRREPGRPRVQLHPRRTGRAAGRIRHLAAAHPRTRAGPDRGTPPPHHRELRPPLRGQGAQPGGETAAPGAGPARYLRQPGVPPTGPAVRFRAQHRLRSRRPDVLV